MLFYSAAWLLPLSAAIGVGAAGVVHMNETAYAYRIRLGALGTVDAAAPVFFATYGLPLLIVIVLGFLRLSRAVRQTRFANA